MGEFILVLPFRGLEFSFALFWCGWLFVLLAFCLSGVRLSYESTLQEHITRRLESSYLGLYLRRVVSYCICWIEFMLKNRPAMIPPTLSNPPTPQNLTSDSRPLPLRIPDNSVKVHSLVAYFDRKIHKEVTPVTSSPHNCPDWRAIPRDKVKSLVLKFSCLGIATPVSNSRISTVSLVTGDGGYSQVGEAAVDNGGVVSGGKGEGGDRAPLRSASLLVGDTPSCAISSSGSVRDTDGSTSEDLRAGTYRKWEKLRSVKGGKNSKRGRRRGKSGSIDGQSVVARKSMRRKASVKSPERETVNRSIKDISLRGGPPGRPEQPGDRLLGGLEGLAQRESLWSSPLGFDPTGTDPPASPSVLDSEAAAVQKEADAQIKSHEIGNTVSDPVSKCPILGAVGRTFRSMRDSFRKKAPPRQMPPATTTTTEGMSELVGRASEQAGYTSRLTVDKAISSFALGDDTACTAKYLTAHESFLQSRRSSNAGSSTSGMGYEAKELDKPGALRSETEDGNSSREGLVGTASDKVLDVDKALDAAQIGGSDRRRSPTGSPLRSPSLIVRGGVPLEEPAGKPTSERRKPNAGKEIVREVPKRNIVQDGQLIIDQKMLGEGGVANRGIKKMKDELDNHSYHGQTSFSKSNVPRLAPKANSTGTNSYNILPPPQSPLGSGGKYVVNFEEETENDQYQDYMGEPEQAHLLPPPLQKCAVNSGLQTTDGPSEMYYPPSQERSGGYDPQPIIEEVLSGNNEGLDGSGGGGGGWRSLRYNNEQFRRGRRERVIWTV
ncbi:hypothetical protein HOY80DRAFT_943426 [Tuber brumale]|nr:hypothetical protein HOY80DRAFT_943426 [Tuber brumale]